MSSNVPKVKVSSSKKREKVDLTCDSGTTTNFGFVQPTFAREMIPNSKFEVSVNSRILNAPMPVPTYGRINLLHKHVFVPYVDVCPQFQSFVSGQSYKPAAADSYIPSMLPYMDIVKISQYILSHFADWSIHVKFSKSYDPGDNPNPFVDLGYNDYEYKPILLDPENPTQTQLNAASIALGMVYNPTAFEGVTAGYFYGRSLGSSQWTTLRNDLNKLLPSGTLLDGRGNRNSSDVRTYGNLLLGGWHYEGDSASFLSDVDDFSIFDYDDNPNGKLIGSSVINYVTLESADYISKFGTTNGLDIVVAFKLRPAGKRFRSILLGLGYQFTPNLYGKVDNPNWLKLLAFYKSWFNCYRPKRDLTFTNTYCYDLIKILELPNAETIMYGVGTPGETLYLSDEVCQFIMDCCFTSYYLPQDYFGMSIESPNRSYYGSDDTTKTIPSLADSISLDGSISVRTNDRIQIQNNAGSSYPNVNYYPNNTRALSMLAIRMGLQILKYVNKNTIVGRSIVDFYRVHYGINLVPSHDNEKVFEIGDVRIPIDINIVQSQAGTDTDELGSYAAFGIGYNKQGNKFIFDNDKDGDFGVWITLTTVVPNSGYSQGVLRENDSLKPYDFFVGEFDALGYDIIKRSEVSADYPTQTSEFNQTSESDFNLKQAFGFVPRYSHYKVSRNILSGELSLRGSQAQYGGYSLDRKIPYEQTLPYYVHDVSENKYYQYNRLARPNYIPSIVFDNFRRLDFSDRLGNYNRIFYSESTLDDHFIITSTFKVDAWLPAMSLSESFDTLSDDTKVIDVTHS